MEDGELVAVVLREPDLRVVELELEPVRRRRAVPARLVPLGPAVAEEDEPAGFARRFPLRVRDELRAPAPGNHHPTVPSLAMSTPPALQQSADPSPQPAAPRIPTIV